MDKKGKKKKESDDSAQPPPHKGRLKFAPKVPHKKDLKIAPKMETEEESEEYTVDNDMMLMMKLKTSQDCNLNNYTITRPIRRPPSGDPAMHDEEEFGQSSSNRDHDGELTTAKELEPEDVAEPELLFFQLPWSFPLPRVEPVTEESTDTNVDVNTQVTASDWSDQKRRHESIQGCRLEELPGGLRGKILVYKSGKVKMKLGDALFDVSAGIKCEFLQEVVAINTREKHFCSLGKIRKRLIVTPDIDYLLDSTKME